MCLPLGEKEEIIERDRKGACWEGSGISFADPGGVYTSVPFVMNQCLCPFLCTC